MFDHDPAGPVLQTIQQEGRRRDPRRAVGCAVAVRRIRARDAQSPASRVMIDRGRRIVMPEDVSTSLRTPAPVAPRSEAARRRLRRIGTCILAIGVIAAGLTYWIETRNAGPSIDDLFPTAAAENARQMGILYGQTWATVFGWMNDLALPGGQAFLIIVGAAIVSALCFHVARLRDDNDAPPRP